MGIVDRFLKYWKQRAAPQHQEAPTVTNQAPLFIEAYDAFGRMVTIPRDEWREKVLLPQLRQNWDFPDALFANVVTALGDAFASEVLPAAEQLVTLYPKRPEYVSTLGQVYLKLSRFKEAEALFESYCASSEANGAILVSLALAYNALDQLERTETTLWHALQVDPNHPIGGAWWLAREHSRNGDKGYVAALNKLAAISGSWRAKRQLAVIALADGQLEDALTLYSRVINAESDNGDALALVAGDLVANGHFADAVKLVAKSYSPRRHGAGAGFALMEAYLATKKSKRAATLLHGLFMLHHPPIHARLTELSRRLDELKAQTPLPRKPTVNPVEIRHLLIHSPVYSFGLSGIPRWLLPPKTYLSKKVTFLPFTRLLREGDALGHVPETNSGRLTRSLPLYLMEALLLRTEALTSLLLAHVPGVGPAIHGIPMDRETLMAMNVPSAQASDVIVTGTIEIVDEQYRVTVTAWDAYTYKIIATIRRDITEIGYGECIHRIEAELTDALGLTGTQHAADYPGASLAEQLPAECMLAYLSAIGQSVSLLLISEGLVELDDMWGERTVIAAPLDLAISYPNLELMRVLFLTNLWFDKDAQSDTFAEFRLQNLALLETSPTGSVFHRLSPLVYKLFEMGGEYERRKQELARTADGDYADWLKRI